jgi:hypothetical protein
LKQGNSGALGIGRAKLCELVRFSFRVLTRNKTP